MIAVVGPTATGKTALGILIAKALNGEIISADSRVIYRHLDIGTAKPTLEERQGIPHHMLDIAEPNQQYSASLYREQALPILENIRLAGKRPVIVGGTGFYIRSLLESGLIPSVPPNPELREELTALAECHGSAYLHQRLAGLDPERAGQLHPNDRFRIIRALEIIQATGKAVPQTSETPNSSVCWIGLTYEDRDLLRKRIDERIETMIQAGWIEEVESLIKRYGPDVEALRVAHGYPEWVCYLQGRMTFEEAKAQIQINIHQYARRQMTWFRRNPLIHWIFIDQHDWGEVCRIAFSLLYNES